MFNMFANNSFFIYLNVAYRAPWTPGRKGVLAVLYLHPSFDETLRDELVLEIHNDGILQVIID